MKYWTIPKKIMKPFAFRKPRDLCVLTKEYNFDNKVNSRDIRKASH